MSSSQSPTDVRPDLQSLKKPALVPLAKKVGVASAGTCDEMRKLIQEAWEDVDKDANEEAPSKHLDEDDWFALIKERVPRISRVPISWNNQTAILTPAFWPALCFLSPPKVSDMFGEGGTDGVLLRSLKEKWTLAFGCSDVDIRFLRDSMITVWSLTREGQGGRIWLERFWSHQVVPVISFTREMQAKRADKNGDQAMAAKIRRLAANPLENTSADLHHIVGKQCSHRHPSDKQDDDTSDDEDEKKVENSDNSKKCRKCKKFVTDLKGKEKLEAFHKHNLICEKK